MHEATFVDIYCWHFLSFHTINVLYIKLLLKYTVTINILWENPHSYHVFNLGQMLHLLSGSLIFT